MSDVDLVLGVAFKFGITLIATSVILFLLLAALLAVLIGWDHLVDEVLFRQVRRKLRREHREEKQRYEGAPEFWPAPTGVDPEYHQRVQAFMTRYREAMNELARRDQEGR